MPVVARCLALALLLAVLAGSSISHGEARPACYPSGRADANDDTAAIQAALDSCRGGLVVLRGHYVSGPLLMHSGTELRLAKDALLEARTDRSAYALPNGKLLPLLRADRGASHISVTGDGTIDGQGSAWWPLARAAIALGVHQMPRPRLIYFTDCSDVTISGTLAIRNAPLFHVVLYRVQRALVEGVTISAPADSPNTDGIDPIDSRDITIRNVTIDVGDDDVAIKSDAIDPEHPHAATANIAIRDSRIRHGHGISIGSNTNGGVSGITVENVTFEDTRYGVRIKSGRDRGGVVEHVIFRNLVMKGVETPIVITAYYLKKPPDNDSAVPMTATTPRFSNITIDHLTASDGANAGLIAGLPESPVKALVLSDIRIQAARGLAISHAALLTSRVTIDAADGRPFVNGPGAVIAAPTRRD